MLKRLEVRLLIIDLLRAATAHRFSSRFPPAPPAPRPQQEATAAKEKKGGASSR
jgi:hypothetical protein